MMNISYDSKKKENSGGEIWTHDLRVMSPTSYQAAPPRDESNDTYYVPMLRGFAPQRPFGPAPLAETITFLSSLAILGSYSYCFNSIPGCLPRRSPEADNGIQRES